MAPPIPDRQVRISRLGGRYLVFDIDDVLHIRRHHGICAVCTGTMPQAPTQNIFLGLPIELYAEEARLLVDKGAARIVDDAADHLSQLTSMDPATRKSYLQSLKSQRNLAKQQFDDAKARSGAAHAHKRKAKENTAADETDAPATTPAGGNEDVLFDSTPPAPVQPVARNTTAPAITPTTSTALFKAGGKGVTIPVPASYPLYAFLNARGYYITPGLRFGGDYSVYPGDPFRFHAHYMANSYGWDEEIPMLDLVTSGRLGTAVKKSFLLGAQKPTAEQPGSGPKTKGEDVRVFCIEWAGM
ncbi:putative tRNA-splicing endonuclease subunit tsp-4 [Podospora conica]|nr:putative tRNA-splicing endonuclease subunit tsp-4 [Schizothecium conicum]